MAFSQSSAQDHRSKILEELQLKKQLLIKGGAGALTSPPISTTAAVGPMSVPQGIPQPGDAHTINPTQRNALLNANTTSWGFFVPQDSSFGNLILPVLPRFESQATQSTPVTK